MWRTWYYKYFISGQGTGSGFGSFYPGAFNADMTEDPNRARTRMESCTQKLISDERSACEDDMVSLTSANYP